jgi:hypothetical protein
MKRLWLFLMSVAVSSAATLSTLTFDHITFSGWQVHTTVTGSYDGMRLLFAVSPAACSNPAGAGVTTEQNTVGGGSSGAARLDTSGKTGNTTYNVCIQTLSGGVWTTGASGQVKTAPPLAGGYVLPPKAAQVNTAYPAEIVSNTNTDTYTVPTSPGCATFHACMNQAVANVATRNAVINLPVGQANTQSGPVYIDQTWPDERLVSNASVNASDNSITLSSHGWLDNQAVILGRTGANDVPNGIVHTDFEGADGRPYYVKRKDANSFWLYDKPLTKGGKRMPVTPNGSGNFKMVAYPRAVKNIIVRTATPDSQFAAPGTALGGMQWNSLMSWMTNTAANRCRTCTPLLNFNPAGDTFTQIFATNLTFVGIAFTVEDDPVAKGEIDPAPWNFLVRMQQATQNIIFDRCALFMPSGSQRAYTALNLAGVNNAFVNSWFDSSLHAYHAMITNFPITSATNGGKTIVMGNGTNNALIGGPTPVTLPYTQITATLTGAPTSGIDQRVSMGFPVTGSTTTLQVYVPAGMSGSCTGGTCNFVTKTAPAPLDCDTSASSRAQWPTDGAGEVTVRPVACFAVHGDGNLWFSEPANMHTSDKGFFDAGEEGTQMIQGSYGPGPLTFRNNDLFLTGNTFHLADDGGYPSKKNDIWIYRNRFRAYWPGMYGALGLDGNAYGNRNHAIETKGYSTITIEGNLFGGNYNDRSQARGGEVIFLRSANQNGDPGGSNSRIESNLFEHVAGGVQPGDTLSGSCYPQVPGTAPTTTCGATPINSFVYNNVFLDVNQLGPDNGCTKALGCLPAGIGTYASPGLTDVESGQGWLMNGPQVSEGLFLYRNTMPDLRGSIPTLSYGSKFQNGGMMLKDNIFSLRADAFAQTYGAREGDNGRPAACAAMVNFALFSCLFPNPSVSGNVILSQTASQATLNTTGWQTNNTIPASPGNLTAIFPNYNLNPTNASPAWTGDIDPESVRLPAGSAYTGKGADITLLKATMGYVDSPGALFDASNNLLVTWLAPDTQACTVDYGTGSLYSNFGRSSLDTGGSRYRKITIPAVNFTANTTYNIRINCERFAPVLHARSN